MKKIKMQTGCGIPIRAKQGLMRSTCRHRKWTAGSLVGLMSMVPTHQTMAQSASFTNIAEDPSMNLELTESDPRRGSSYSCFMKIR